MTEDLKQQLKNQALAHWKDNLERLCKMDWDVWVRCCTEETRLVIAVHSVRDTNAYPHIGGRSCPYCQEYGASCQTDKGYVCPLYEDECTCCKEWREVFRALVYGSSQDTAIEAVKAMIRRIEEC